MKTWRVEMHGDSFDLEVFLRAFPIGGEVHFAREGGKFFMCAVEMNECAQPGEVQAIAQTLLTGLYPILKLSHRNLSHPTLGVIWEYDDKEPRRGYALMSASLSGRGGLSAQGSPISEITQATGDEILRAMLRKNPRLKIVTDILAGDVNISQLYRCLEELEKHLLAFNNMGICKNGLCSSSEHSLFKQTANTWTSDDGHARHPSGTKRPPPKPMSLEVAEEFILDLTKKILEKFAV